MALAIRQKDVNPRKGFPPSLGGGPNAISPQPICFTVVGDLRLNSNLSKLRVTGTTQHA